MEMARLVVAPRETMMGMPATEHFRAMSEDTRPVQATKVRLKIEVLLLDERIADGLVQGIVPADVLDDADRPPFCEEAHGMHSTRGYVRLGEGDGPHGLLSLLLS